MFPSIFFGHRMMSIRHRIHHAGVHLSLFFHRRGPLPHDPVRRSGDYRLVGSHPFPGPRRASRPGGHRHSLKGGGMLILPMCVAGLLVVFLGIIPNIFLVIRVSPLCALQSSSGAPAAPFRGTPTPPALAPEQGVPSGARCPRLRAFRAILWVQNKQTNRC